ncbi:MAG: YceI family protein [Usitatibacter sp.]
MKRMLLPATIVALFTALPASAELETFTVDPNHTFPAFEIGHFGFSLQRGRFNKTTGKVTLDIAAKQGSADIAIDTGSVSTGHAKLEEHLRSEDFFNSAKNPQMTFKSNNFAFEGDKVKSASGDLTINGVTRPVTLKADQFNCAPHPMLKKKACGAELTTTIKRSDFGIKTFLPAVADDVMLRINVEAIKD